jgi:hypothetical protein
MLSACATDIGSFDSSVIMSLENKIDAKKQKKTPYKGFLIVE